MDPAIEIVKCGLTRFDTPPGATLVFSANGINRAIEQEARARGFQVFDATCPLVTRVHGSMVRPHTELTIHHDRPQAPPEVESIMGPV